MDKLSSKEWAKRNNVIRNIENRECVTIRATYTHSKRILIRISLGLVICDLLDLKKGDRVEIFCNKKDKNILLVRKAFTNDGYYTLNYSKLSHFLTFDFVCDFNNDYKISQTTKVDFDFKDKNIILNVSKLRWEK